VFHLHSEIVKEHAFFRLDTVSSTRGQIELRLWLPIKRRSANGEETGGKASDGGLENEPRGPDSITGVEKTCRIPRTLESQKSSNRFLSEGGATPSSQPKNFISSSSENPGGGLPEAPATLVASEEQIPVKLFVRAKILYRPSAAREGLS
jgi:hypothetical protein